MKRMWKNWVARASCALKCNEVFQSESSAKVKCSEASYTLQSWRTEGVSFKWLVVLAQMNIPDSYSVMGKALCSSWLKLLGSVWEKRPMGKEDC